MAKYHVSTTINGEPVEFLCDPQQTLLDVLRDELNLTGSKEGCSSGDCGACSVIMDGKLVSSCLTLAVRAEGAEITTIEGIGSMEEGLHPLQDSFAKHGATQCGYCTPGMIVSAYALLNENSDPTEEEIKHWLTGNLCRCTGYQKIVDAIRAVAEGRTEPGPDLGTVIVKAYENEPGAAK